ncbi:TolC family outer membrane protein [Aestuariicella hydrocarbonica]|uniref:TolC family outer membrane protein n=1 Tax=Pseudomaricurvus hydrocarbonicus TaxID=1470433 RepID=A0A9E5MKH6_9GAMM|nr:TolC family outer membrane protein [Aestuariicella hydrocarbonica]NHO66534.1 TolC family outer membrane protein [Aestuariicella hydrocarbonica]
MLKRRLTLALVSTAVSLCAMSPLQAETLEEIYRLALENDHQLKADTAAYEAGKENLTIGRSALLPQINAQASYSETEQTTLGESAFTSSPPEYEIESENEAYSVTLTQPLFNMAAWFGYQQGKSLSHQAQAQFSADQQSLIIRVSEAYFTVLRAIDNLTTARAEEKALGHQLEQTKQRFDVGLTAITDVHEAQAAYDNATATTLEARGNLAIAFEGLEVLTGQQHEQVAPLVENFPVTNPAPMQRSEWVDFALNNNYTLQVAKYNAEAFEDNARAAASGHLPTLSANLSYGNRDDSNTDIFVNGSSASNDSRINDRSTIGVRLDVPIFSGLRVSGQRRQAYSQSMQADEIYNKTQRDIIQGARSLHLSVVTNVAQVNARQQAITSSRSALEATQAGYEVGTRNLVDVLIAQQNLYQAQRNYDDTRYAYIVNMLRLKEVAGNLTPEDVLQLNRWLNVEKQVDRSLYEIK